MNGKATIYQIPFLDYFGSFSFTLPFLGRTEEEAIKKAHRWRSRASVSEQQLVEKRIRQMRGL